MSLPVMATILSLPMQVSRCYPASPLRGGYVSGRAGTALHAGRTRISAKGKFLPLLCGRVREASPSPSALIALRNISEMGLG
ncbi:MAG: hypothetical protein K6T17_04320 [Fimbriimonadales bacterium]|nr:hypothetical protein [Fimbriimonadales bacterium]